MPASTPVLPATPATTVRARLMEQGAGFSNAELKVVRQLLANYPTAGLTTISRLAKAAEVSDPTVLRLASRLGYGGFAEMQTALLAEVEAHMRSPLTLSSASESSPALNVYELFLARTLAQCDAVARETATADYERVVALLTNPRLRILCLGGRFSRFIAGILQRSLHHLRDGTRLLEGSSADIIDELASVGRRHVLVVFDYRRYQSDVIRLAETAKAQGSVIVLFTDIWKSPIAAFADVMLTAPTDTASPFDTLVTPLLQVEAIVAAAVDRIGADWRVRAQTLEQVRAAHHVTVQDDPGPPAHRPDHKRAKTSRPVTKSAPQVGKEKM